MCSIQVVLGIQFPVHRVIFSVQWAVCSSHFSGEFGVNTIDSNVKCAVGSVQYTF